MNGLVIAVLAVIALILVFLVLRGKDEGLSISQFSSPCFRPSPFIDGNIGTFDSGSTFQRYYNGIPPFPEISCGLNIVGVKQKGLTSEKEIKEHLDAGGVVVVASTEEAALAAIDKVIQEGQLADRWGYPDFYEIPGPIVVFGKQEQSYTWMTGYPISYMPSNVSKFINMNDNWNVARKALYVGLRNLEMNAPVLFLA